VPRVKIKEKAQRWRTAKKSSSRTELIGGNSPRNEKEEEKVGSNLKRVAEGGRNTTQGGGGPIIISRNRILRDPTKEGWGENKEYWKKESKSGKFLHS